MKLLLDEQYPPGIAARLRDRGRDAVHARELGLEGASDEVVLDAAAASGRALVTNNVRHFVPIVRRWEGEGRMHAGLVFTSDRSLPRSADGIGDLARALERLEGEHGPGGLGGTTVWLAPSP